MRDVQLVLVLVVFAVLVTTFAERIRAPAPSLLALAGVGLGLLPGIPQISLDPTAVSLAVLPPLLYAASTDVAFSELRTVLRQVSFLAVGLVAASAAAVAVVVHLVVPDVPMVVAFVLGSVLASTDPVAVTALARRLDLPPRLLALVQGESLLNDATSLVLFQVAVGIAAAGGGVHVGAAAGRFVVLAGGGAAVGLALGLAVELLRRRIEDPVLETVVALVVPYVVYVSAQSLGTSGVTAVVIAGLWLGSRDLQLSTGASRLRIASVYGVIVFLLESVVFAVIGLQLPNLLRQLPAADRNVIPGVLAVTVTVILSRVAWVYPTSYLPVLVRRLRRRGAAAPDEKGWQVPAVVSWAGTRGVVPLAAALSIPLLADDGSDFPRRTLLLVLASGCIVTTLVVQGLTLEPLVRRLGVTADPYVVLHGEARARLHLARAALSRLDELEDLESVSPFDAQRLRPALEEQAGHAEERLVALHAPAIEPRQPASPEAREEAFRLLRHDLITVQTESLLQLRRDGVIDEAVRRRLQGRLDVAEAALRTE